jgi:outer membrane lipoprotein-sorting protein
MLSLIVAAVLCAQAPQGPQAPPAAPILTKMFGRYMQAKSLVGQITQTATVNGRQAKYVTVVEYERPYLLYIRTTGKDKEWITSATGTQICYHVPNDKPSTHVTQLGESQLTDSGTKTIGDVYVIASQSQGDKSLPLDLVIANTGDLVKMRDHWATIANSGKSTVNGVTVNRITGGWRPAVRAAVCAQFELDVTDEGDLVRYAMTQDLRIENVPDIQHIVIVWDCDLKVDAKPDASLFKVYK